MTSDEIREFKNLVNQNMHQALCLDGCSISSSERLAYAVTIAEYVRDGKTTAEEKPEKQVYDGIIHLEQLRHSLTTTISLLNDFGCDSLSDIKGFCYSNGKVLFRVKGREAAAPINFKQEDVDLVNYVRSFVGLLPLEEGE